MKKYSRLLTIFVLIWIPAYAEAFQCTKENISQCVEEGSKAFKKGDFQKTVSLMELPCQVTKGPSCGLIGAIFRDGGGGVKRDTQKALAYMKQACEGSYSKSCMDMGILYQSHKKIDKAVESYEAGCTKNNVGSCYNLATMYYRGDGIPKSLEKAKEFYKKACDLGDRENGCKRYEMLSSGVMTRSDVDAFITKCKQKDGVACHNISAVLYKSKKFKEAFDFEVLACLNKYAMGCKNVALNYFKGEHVAKDPQKALEFFKAAGSLGEGSGFFNAGNMYQFGKGIKKDLQAAKEMYERGCFALDMPSCVKLGYFFEKGITVKPNAENAVWFYKNACEHKESKGCMNMAFLNYEGEVIRQDFIKAKNYFEKACELGNEQGCTYAAQFKVVEKK